VKNCYVLIISHNRLFIEALTRLVQGAGAQVKGTATDLQTALPFFQAQSVNAIVVDQNSLHYTECEIITYLAAYRQPYQIFFLTANNDQMIIYRREEIRYTSPENLVQLLCTSA